MHANKLYLYRYARPQEEHVWRHHWVLGDGAWTWELRGGARNVRDAQVNKQGLLQTIIVAFHWLKLSVMVTPSLVRMVRNGNHFKLQLVLEAAGPVNLEEGCFDKIKAAMPSQQPAIAADSNGQNKPAESEATTADQDCGVGFNILYNFIRPLTITRSPSKLASRTGNMWSASWIHSCGFRPNWKAFVGISGTTTRLNRQISPSLIPLNMHMKGILKPWYRRSRIPTNLVYYA